MIDAHVWTTPNGYKALIALEELGLPYQAHWVDLGKGQQSTPAFRAVNPNAKIPAIVDHEPAGGGPPLAVFESGAILTYLADKTGKFLAKSGADRYTALSWVFFNIGNTGPMLGQLGFFSKSAPEKIPLAIDRYTKEAQRLFGVLDGRLAQAAYLAGDEYTIADMINVTWIRAARDFLALDLGGHTHLTRWLGAVEARPAVARALAMKP
ncbi:MAG TPA: glutathione S-transferase N-terminal domain-containing protein [Kofleriaceae bacterium]|nr:glutathione S-transferase N-terminal domain-containing protein [Kofleriaceae bacterium]